MTDAGVRAEVCVGAVVVYDDELLLIRRGHGPGAGEWSVPGGRVEGGEMLAEAVLREVREEAGVEVVCGSLLGVVERIHDDRHFVILDYQATVLEKQDPVPGDDAVEARWVPLTDVAELRLVEGLAEFLHEHGVIETIA
ncbi:MAG TPA: NUDIX domain-containing protein [Acidimicrobiales bacterium]|nr:NUDIX domain-containing protein [Acidimicrobiales bacterium]